MIDKDGVEVDGVDIEIVWNYTYEELGKEDLEDEEFNINFAKQVEEEIEIL